MPTVNGIDVSEFQNHNDWVAIHNAGFSWAGCRATHGLTTDARFAENYPAIAAAGLLRSAYHYFIFADSPADQANHFLNIANPQPGDLPPMLDIEDAPNMPAARAVQVLGQFLQIVEARTHARCLLYMGPFYWRDQLGSTDAFAGHPLWIAEYLDPRATFPPPARAVPPAVLPPPPVMTPPWPNWTMWQYSSSGHVAGVGSTNVDLDVFNGDINALRALRLH